VAHPGSTWSRRISGYAFAYNLDLFSNFTYFLNDPVNGDQFEQADRRLVSGMRASHERVTRWTGRYVEQRFGVQLRRDDIGLLGLYHTRARSRLSTVADVFKLFNARDSDVDYFYASRLPGETVEWCRGH